MGQRGQQGSRGRCRYTIHSLTLKKGMPKKSGCDAVTYFYKAWLEPQQGAYCTLLGHSYKGNSLMQVISSQHSQTLSLMLKIGHREKTEFGLKSYIRPW